MMRLEPGTNRTDMSVLVSYYEELYHDIKTPMSILFAYIQMMEKVSAMPSEALRYLEEIKRSYFRIAKLVRDANDRTRLDNGLVIPQYSNLDVVSFVRNLCENAETLMERKNIHIQWNCRLPYKVMAIDRQLLERILLNLLANAKEYSNVGGLIRVRLWESGKNIFISVRDSGPGIAPASVSAIFARHAGTSQRGLHAGLGLYIVKELTALLGGDVKLANTRPGAEMVVRLPVFLTDKSDESIPMDDFFSDNAVQMELAHVMAAR